MDDELANLISALGDEEAVSRLKSLLEGSKAKLGDCREEKEEIEKLRQKLAETERELERTKKFVSELIRQIPKPAFVLFLNKDGFIEYINEYAAEIYGASISEMVGKRPSDLARNLAAGGKTFVELAFENKMKIEGKEGFLEVVTGKSMPILTSCAPIYIDDEFVGMVDFFIDITEQKKKEEEARKAYNLIREVFRNLPTYVIFVGQDGQIKFANENAARLGGYSSAEDVVGLKPTDIAVVHDEYKDEAKKLVEAIKKRERIENIELKLVSKSEGEFYASASVYPVYVEGEFAGYIEVFVDITDRKEKEEELAKTLAEIDAIVKGMPDAFYVVDAERKIVTWSKQAEELTGYSESEALGRKSKELFALNEDCLVCNTIIAAMEAGEAARDVEGTIRVKNGTKHVLVSASPKIVEGAVDGAVIFLKDLSEIKRKEKELQELIDSLPVGAFVIGSDHRVKFWNRACEEITGVKASEVVGTNKQWYPFYDEERPVLADLVLENPDKAHELYDTVSRSETIDGAFVATTWVTFRNGRRAYIRATAAPLRDEEGNVVGVVETLEDLTEIKEKEKEMAELLDAIAAPVIRVDKDFTILATNKATETFLASPETK